MKTGFIIHPDTLHHQTGPGHPESPQRLSVLQSRLLEENSQNTLKEGPVLLKVIQPVWRADLYDWISKVHRRSYSDLLKARVPKTGLVYLDPDTPMAPMSLRAAELAVSGVLTAVDDVLAGSIRNAFCAIRPPGHHAEADHAMGFCFFNNVAIGARYIQEKYGLPRVFIVDWDVHHGNGTQHLFYHDPSIFYFSTHQFPCYPGTGSESERGTGEAEGTTLNCPLPSGSGDALMLSKFERDLADAVSSFRPDFMLISAGFDAHRDDPLANLMVTERGFDEMTKIVARLAVTYCKGRIVSCLEGGYNLDALTRSVRTHLAALGAFSS
ncbi:MAG: histone deacetylase [Nitrospiria bacterium]